MSAWDDLDHELDAWEDAGRRATLWWRDDDACSDTPALRRLLHIAGENEVPIAVAAIPARADATLVDAVGASVYATIVQHGYEHANHQPAGERAAELGSHRSVAECLDELGNGRVALQRLLGSRFHAVLVPPWNRIAGALVSELPSAGLTGLSCFGPRETAAPSARLWQVNTHVDLIAWKRQRAFIGVDSAIARLVAHLAARRSGTVDGAEATGLLTHHLVFTPDAFDFVDALCARTRSHPAVKWLDVTVLFDAAPTRVT